MTDEHQTTETQSQSGPDGFVIVHRPKDKTITPYGIGPFPPVEGLAARIMAALVCDCECMTLPIAFPKGIKMMLVADEDSVPGMALVNLMASLGAAIEDDGPVH